MQQTKKQKNLSNLTVGKCDISTDYPIISATKNTVKEVIVRELNLSSCRI